MISYGFKETYEKFMIKALKRYFRRNEIFYYFKFNASANTYSYNLVVQDEQNPRETLFEVEFEMLRNDENSVPTLAEIKKILKTKYPEYLI